MSEFVWSLTLDLTELQRSFILNFVWRVYTLILLCCWHWKLPKNFWGLQTYFPQSWVMFGPSWNSLIAHLDQIWASFSWSGPALGRSSTQREVTSWGRRWRRETSQSAAFLSIIYCWKHKYSTNLLWTNAITTFLSVLSFAQNDSLQLLNQLLQLQKMYFCYTLTYIKH